MLFGGSQAFHSLLRVSQFEPRPFHDTVVFRNTSGPEVSPPNLRWPAITSARCIRDSGGSSDARYKTHQKRTGVVDLCHEGFCPSRHPTRPICCEGGLRVGLRWSGRCYRRCGGAAAEVDFNGPRHSSSPASGCTRPPRFERNQKQLLSVEAPREYDPNLRVSIAVDFAAIWHFDFRDEFLAQPATWTSTSACCRCTCGEKRTFFDFSRGAGKCNR